MLLYLGIFLVRGSVQKYVWLCRKGGGVLGGHDLHLLLGPSLGLVDIVEKVDTLHSTSLARYLPITPKALNMKLSISMALLDTSVAALIKSPLHVRSTPHLFSAESQAPPVAANAHITNTQKNTS